MLQLIYTIVLAFIICMALGPVLIPLLQKLKFGQVVRDDGPKQHLTKSGTPTMGGAMILAAVTITVLVFTRGNIEFSLISCLVTLGYGLIGFLDDIIKINMKRSMGLRAYQKIIGQFGLAIVLAIYAYSSPQIGSKIMVPFINLEWDLGVFYIPAIIFIVIGAVNSVNLTDGLDGLASGVMMIIAVTFSIIFLLLSTKEQDAGNIIQASNMQNMMVFAGALAGACLGFMRFNVFPAKVFMGDTGALALGGALSMLAVMSRGVLLLPLVAAMFMVSTISVILQVGSYKLRNKKRVFLMAPLHHHYELKGYMETTIVSMYMIITTILCLVGLLAYL